MPAALLAEVAAIEDGDASAMRCVLERTGKLVGPRDVTAAAGGIGVEAFVESLLDPVDDLSEIDDADAEALLTNVMAVSYSDADTQRALRALERTFDQPALTDLIYWPRADLTAKEIVRVARSTRGEALVPWLSPECGSPAEHVARSPSSSSLTTARQLSLRGEDAGRASA